MTESYNAQKDGELSYLVAIEAIKNKKLAARINKPIAPPESPLHMIQPYREGKKVWVVINGKRLDLHPAMVGIIARNWQEALSGAFTAVMTE